MGPVIGMTPEKKAETPGAEKVAVEPDLQNGKLAWSCWCCQAKATLVDNESADDELTNLNWLHRKY